MDPKKHDKLINNTMADIKNGVYDNLKALEESVAEMILSGADPAILRPAITTEFEKFASGVKTTARQVTDLSADSGVVTTEDLVAEAALAEQTGNAMAQEFAGGAETIMTNVVVGTAAGFTANQIAKAARASISGVFMTSGDSEVKRQQRTLTKLFKATDANPKEIAKAVRVIRERLNDVNTTNSLRDLTNKATEQAVMQFDGAFTFGKAKRAGVKRFTYEGGSMDTSRDWCMEHLGETYTEEEIRDLWSSSWAGKAPGDPFVVRGGYNCTHFWVPVEED